MLQTDSQPDSEELDPTLIHVCTWSNTKKDAPYKSFKGSSRLFCGKVVYYPEQPELEMPDPLPHGQDILIFIHGFAHSEQAALSKTAQLALLTNWDSQQKPVFAYCWGSAGVRGLQGYLQDLGHLDSAAPDFAHHLQDLLRNDNRVRIVAHSMGANLAFKMLCHLNNSQGGKVEQVIFVAPDVSTDEFIMKENVDLLTNVVANFTVYHHFNDMVLSASRGVRSLIPTGADTINPGKTRLGLMAWDFAQLNVCSQFPGLHTVDVQGMMNQPWKKVITRTINIHKAMRPGSEQHTYFLMCHKVYEDIAELLAKPGQHSNLVANGRKGNSNVFCP